MSDIHLWPKVTILRHSGIPLMHLNSDPCFGSCAKVPLKEPHCSQFVNIMHRAGIKMFQVEASGAANLYYPELSFWTGPETFDPSAMVAHFQTVSDCAPEALFMLRVYLGAPEWWLDAHPDHLQISADGATLFDLRKAGQRRLPSLASPQWQSDSCRSLNAFVRWLLDSGWSRKITALLLCYGVTWEWGMFGCERMIDYSRWGYEYFRDYLRMKYRSEDALSEAWGKETSFDAARIPSSQRRNQVGGLHGCRKVPREQDVIDHQESLSMMNAEHLIRLCKCVRTACDRTGPLIGAFYGYTVTAREHDPDGAQYGAGGFLGGHHALNYVLDSEHIDFLASPYSYADRTLENGVLSAHGPVSSVHRHGKAWFDENDNRTFLNNPGDAVHPLGLDVGYDKDIQVSLERLRWAFGASVLRGKHMWLMELGSPINGRCSIFDHPELLKEIARLGGSAENLVKRDISANRQIAFVLDEKSIPYLSLDNKDFEQCVYRRMPQFMRLGCAVDVLLLRDLIEEKHPPWNVVVPCGICAPHSLDSLRLYRDNHPEVMFSGDGSPSHYPQASHIRFLGESAGVHFYTERGVLAWENASMLLTVGNNSQITLPGPGSGVDIFSGQRYVTDNRNNITVSRETPVHLFVWD